MVEVPERLAGLLQVSRLHEHAHGPASTRRTRLAPPLDGGGPASALAAQMAAINPYGTFTLNMSERLPLA